MTKSPDYSKARILCTFIEKSDRLSTAARFMLKAMADGNWTWVGLATDTDHDLASLLATVQELRGYLEWVWNSIDLDAYASDELQPLIDDLKRHETVIASMVGCLGEGPIELVA